MNDSEKKIDVMIMGHVSMGNSVAVEFARQAEMPMIVVDTTDQRDRGITITEAKAPQSFIINKNFEFPKEGTNRRARRAKARKNKKKK